MPRIALIALALLTASSIAEAQKASDPRVADLVQSGKIRTALFLPQYTKDSATGEVRGLGMGIIALEVTRALATRLGVEMQAKEQPTPPKAVECLNTSACDVMFLGIEPSRLNAVDFTPSVAQFDYTYLVPSGSPIRSIAHPDRTGGHIATVRGHAAAIVLGHIVKNAEIIAADLPDAAFDLLRTGKADAFALPREQLLHYSAKLSATRTSPRMTSFPILELCQLCADFSTSPQLLVCAAVAADVVRHTKSQKRSGGNGASTSGAAKNASGGSSPEARHLRGLKLADHPE